MIPIYILLVRLACGPLILKWPFFGAIANIYVDWIDFSFLEKFGWGILAGKNLYQQLDKTLDLYYLSFELFILLKREFLIKQTAKILYLWRLCGVVLLWITGNELLTIIFPNIFEFFYMSVIIIWLVKPKFKFTSLGPLFLVLIITSLGKIFEEFIIHYPPFTKYLLEVLNF